MNRTTLLEALSNQLFASAQVVARLYSDKASTRLPIAVVSELLWLDSDELTELYGDTMTADQAVSFVRHASPNHIVLTILNGGNDLV
ncbi:hypothetical protein [Streptomyces sp. BH104]|uniref:hypothetical protein n=1 Tax=Streptomyces sp. BH104 TaxID=3410407 RepID=UPI003BB70421